MRCTLALIATLALASSAAAQLAPQPTLTADILRGYDLVGPITADPHTPGDELLFRQKLWRHIVLIARMHPTRSGPLGVVPAPGLCLEAVTALDGAMADGAISIVDVNGDGLSDLVATHGERVQVVLGMGLTACR